MRRPFTTQQAYANGLTRSALICGVRAGRILDLGRGVYLKGVEPPSEIECALAIVVATGGVACGTLAGLLHGLDAVALCPPYANVAAVSRFPNTRVAKLSPDVIASARGYRCTTGLQTMLELAAVLDDLKWEQALESGLRKKLFTIPDLESKLLQRRMGNARIRRVLKLRPNGAPATESLLETLAVQLMRLDPSLPTPTRQLEILNCYREFQGRVDLAFPDEGVFFELDGQQHKDQPLYDANRQTRVVAATGWMVGRFTWDEIVLNPKATLRRMSDFFNMARSIKRAS